MTSERASVPTRCNACQSHLSYPIVCTGCQRLYPPPEALDYFQLLGLERRYDLDERRLGEIYKSVARHIHPDRFTSAPEEVRRLATKLSADVNNALTVLQDPVRRAAYLLDLAGGPTASEDRSVPGNLLAEVMTLREEIGEAQLEGDADTLQRMHTEVSQQRRDALAEVATLADGLEDATDDAKRTLRRLINAVKYYDNLLAELNLEPHEHAAGQGDA